MCLCCVYTSVSIICKWAKDIFECYKYGCITIHRIFNSFWCGAINIWLSTWSSIVKNQNQQTVQMSIKRRRANKKKHTHAYTTIKITTNRRLPANQIQFNLCFITIIAVTEAFLHVDRHGIVPISIKVFSLRIPN